MSDIGSVMGVCRRKRAIHFDNPWRRRVASASAWEMMFVRQVPTSGDLVSENVPADAPAVRTDVKTPAVTASRKAVPNHLTARDSSVLAC